MKAKKKDEQVLLYQFHDEAILQPLREVLKKLRIRTVELRDEDYREKIGFLLGMKGFLPSKQQDDEPFSFPHEVMIFSNIQGKRLDEVLEAMSAAGIPKIPYKAVVTPFNTLWPLQRLCRTMEKEHGAFIAQEQNN